MVVLWWWIGSGITAVLLSGALWWWVPKRQMRSVTTGDPKDRADIEDNFRKTVGQALGGAFVLLGAGMAYLQFSQQQQASHDLLISNQVARGFEQLASHEIVMRLGGIYALEGVMNTSDQYHQPVLEALCAFMRESTIGMVINGKPTTDTQAALTVIARRGPGAGRVDLSPVRIPEADLIGANLSGAHLTGANLSGAHLSAAHLNGADLSGADLSGADLSGAHLSGAFLSGANLSGTFLGGANLSGADLFRVKLSVADLSGANLSGVNLSGVNLSGADLFRTHLIGADLSGANLSGATVEQLQLDEACGVNAKLPPGLALKPCIP